MAKIYPEHVPESVLTDPKRQAERRVYDCLSSLGAPFVVFYSVAWQSRRDGRARDGEADFVIAHPEVGILVIEVKGGGIAYNAQAGEWTTTDRYGDSYAIDPVEQAKKSHYTLFDKIRDLPGWDNSRYLTIGHAVCFPDIVVENKYLKLDLPREIIIDNNDLYKIDETIRRVFEHWDAVSKRGALGKDRLNIVESLLAHSFKISTPLGVELDKEDERLIQLTEQQYMLLNFLGSRRRAMIAGCAGSGKTMLAVEKAKQLYEQGFNVLLTCYNSALAEELAEKLPEVTVLHFHGLCRELAKKTGFTIQSYKNQQEYFDVVLPEMLMKAVDEVGPMFDAIIIDEGQDFQEAYWIALASLLNEKEGVFYVFYDNNQNLYGGTASLKGIIDEEPFPLNQNCRNTNSIHKVVRAFYSDRDKIFCNGPQGRIPELQVYRGTSDMLKYLQSTLNRLINDEYIAAEDLVILTPHAQENSALRAGTRLGNFILSENPSRRRNEVQATTIHKFKGLERKVVIISEIDSKYMYNPEMLLYVASSRARTHLLFLIHENAPTALQFLIEAACKPGF
jgi:hypothetical protein